MLLTFLCIGNIWFLSADRSLGPVSRCSVATRPMPRALVQEPACKSVVSIISTRNDSLQLDGTVAAPAEGINGALLTRRSVESTGADMSFLRFCTNPDVRNEIETEQKKTNPERSPRHKLPSLLIILTFTCRYLDFRPPTCSQLLFISADSISQALFACRSIYLACYSSTFGHPGLLVSFNDEHGPKNAPRRHSGCDGGSYLTQARSNYSVTIIPEIWLSL